MGLFKNNKKTCPLCGKPTPRVLPLKIEGEAICSDCAGKACAEGSSVADMSMEEFRRHLAYREENAHVLESFTTTKQVPFCVSRVLHIDEGKQLLYFECDEFKSNPPVFPFSELSSYVYYEHMNSDKIFDPGINKDRCPLIIKRGEHFEEKSLTFILQDHRDGILRLENVVDHLLGADEKMLSQVHPIDVFRITFEFENPYFKRIAFDYLSPRLDLNDNDQLRWSTEFATYLERCRAIIDDAKRVGRAVEPILNP